ncbi:hypothetical protein ACIBG0_04160 [Nocardia sp. NPDC050630]|uniref:hypothetical protein n=1 Tax=Nocardia sp. NPDC050630 TaxID=3364321 RepID=UPI0037B9C8F1
MKAESGPPVVVIGSREIPTLVRRRNPRIRALVLVVVDLNRLEAPPVVGQENRRGGRLLPKCEDLGRDLEMTPEQRAEWEEGVKSLYDGMVRIVVKPTWAKLIDFETTLPTAIEELMQQQKKRQRA